MALRRLAICSTLVALAVGTSARACSVVKDYRVPTTLDLVDRADTILLARVAEGEPVAEAPGLLGARLIPFALLKGGSLPAELPHEEAYLANDELKAMPSDPRNLVDANPDAFSGACNRVVFDRDMILLLFLERRNGALRVMAPPFSRSLEDVPSPDALWVKAVKLYIEIGKRPQAERRKEMASRRSALALDIDDADARLLVLELDRALHEAR